MNLKFEETIIAHFVKCFWHKHKQTAHIKVHFSSILYILKVPYLQSLRHCLVVTKLLSYHILNHFESQIRL